MQSATNFLLSLFLTWWSEQNVEEKTLYQSSIRTRRKKHSAVFAHMQWFNTFFCWASITTNLYFHCFLLWHVNEVHQHLFRFLFRNRNLDYDSLFKNSFSYCKIFLSLIRNVSLCKRSDGTWIIFTFRNIEFTTLKKNIFLHIFTWIS